jgi:hypothetical protein
MASSPFSSSFSHRVALVTGSSSGIGYETPLDDSSNSKFTPLKKTLEKMKFTSHVILEMWWKKISKQT